MRIDVNARYQQPRPLNMGTDDIRVNSRYFTVKGAPILPVMGEIHFSRYPADEWRRELSKMRAGGVQVAATYVFWNHHEEINGEWDFSGNRDLGAFVRVCRDINMPLVLRIGPFAHGECRNGGLPDWIVDDKSMTPRTNDAKYIECVRELYMKIGEQVKGQTFKDGGPIIGVQLENEYGHVGGPSDKGVGEAHMKMLKHLALEAGLDVPFFTATGWGGAYIIKEETLPVQGGYVDAPWDQHIHANPPTMLHMFAPFLDDGGTGADWADGAKEKHFTFDPDDYPFLTAELGGGLQVTHHRRTYPSARDVEALTLCRIGSGANLIGYYMYHGGVNPDGKHTTLQESRATGYPNDLPIKSYDFFAPLRESGEASESYGKIRKHLIMLNQFGGDIAPGCCILPDENDRPKDASDADTPRVCVRHDARPGENGGFVFVNNHQRGINMEEKHFSVELNLPDETIKLPEITLRPDACMALPYNFKMDAAVLRATNAQPLCRIGKHWFFWCDGEPVYDFARGEAYIDTLTADEADKACVLNGELFISDALIYSDGESIIAETENRVLSVTRWGEASDPEHIEVRRPEVKCACEFRQIGGVHKPAERKSAYDGDYIEYEIKLGEAKTDGLADMLLELDFGGDRTELYADGRLVADWFNSGEKWRTALKRLGYPKELTMRVYSPTEEFYHDLPVDTMPCLKAARVVPVYRVEL